MAEPEPWTRIYNRIKTQIPAATDAVIRQEIFATAVDFTADTNIWLEEVPITVEPNVHEYPFVVTSGSPNRLMRAWRADDDTYNWAAGGISMRVPGILRIARWPTEPVNWVIAVAKVCSTPQMTTTDPPKETGYPELDSWIVDRHGDAIYYGAMYFMQRQPAKPYYNIKAAMENDAMYKSTKSAARVNNQNANVFGAQTWRFPQGFSTISRRGWS